MREKIKIDKGIAIPERGSRSKWREKLKDLEVGDSFLWPDEGRGKAKSPVTTLRYALPDWKFATRKTEEGLRVWRIK